MSLARFSPIPSKLTFFQRAQVPAQPQPPPPAPTRSAAKPSTSAVATVVTDKKLYQLDEQISVTFLVGAGSSRHWVGIFNANVPISQQKQGNLWLWAGCDRQGFKSGCTPRVSSI